MTRNITFNQYFTWLVAGCAFMLPVSVAGIVLFHSLIILSFMVRLYNVELREKLIQLKHSQVIISLTIFLLLSLLSVTWSEDRTFALVYLQKYYHFLTVPIIYLLLDTTQVRRIVSVFLVGMALSEFMAIGIFLEIIQYKNIKPADPSPFMNHTDFSLYLAFTLIIILTRITEARQGRHRAFYIIFLAISFFCLLISGGRSGQFVFIVLFMVYFLLHFRKKIVFIIAPIVILVVLIVSSYQFMPDFKRRVDYTLSDIHKSVSQGNYKGSFGQRVALWKIGTGVFLNNLLFGKGIGNEKTEINKLDNQAEVRKLLSVQSYSIQHGDHIDFHNSYLQTAVQTGIPGLLSLLYLMYSIFRIEHATQKYKNLNLIFFIAVAMYAAANNLLHTIIPMSFFAFFLSLFIVKSREQVNSFAR